jgi:hypothetical protein
MLSRALAAGAVVAGAPVLLSACTHASNAAPAGTASGGGPGAPDAQVPLFTWRRSLPIDSMSPGIGVIGGTELRALATMDGALYAGNGYWRDSRQTDPALPGAQVLVLDAPAAPWKVDIEFSERIASGKQAGLRREGDVASVDLNDLLRAVDGRAVDLLVNNAGVGGTGRQLTTLSPDELERAFAVKLRRAWITAYRPVAISSAAPVQCAAWPRVAARLRPSSRPSMGMPVSKAPKITPTRSRVRASIPLTPMPIAAAKLDSPKETATSTRATMGQRYRPLACC